jgi:hypothetical protein
MLRCTTTGDRVATRRKALANASGSRQNAKRWSAAGLLFDDIFAAWHKRNATLSCHVACPLATLRNGDDR